MWELLEIDLGFSIFVLFLFNFYEKLDSCPILSSHVFWPLPLEKIGHYISPRGRSYESFGIIGQCVPKNLPFGAQMQICPAILASNISLILAL